MEVAALPFNPVSVPPDCGKWRYIFFPSKAHSRLQNAHIHALSSCGYARFDTYTLVDVRNLAGANWARAWMCDHAHVHACANMQYSALVDMQYSALAAEHGLTSGSCDDQFLCESSLPIPYL